GQFADNPTVGQFAEVKIYNKALSAEEVAAMYDVTDADIVAADKAELEDFADLSAVEGDIVLPTTGVNGSAITWISENTAITIEDGVAKVTRPAAGEADVTGKLVATITYNGESDTKEFDVTVLAAYSDEQNAQYDADKAVESLGDLSAVMGELTLPTVGEKGSSITWESTNSAITIADGVVTVTRPAIGSENATGTLKATVTYGTATVTKEVDVTVIAFRESVTLDTVEAVEVTTLVGHSPSLPNYVKATYTDGSMNKVKAVWPAYVDAANYAAAGTFTVEGSIVGETKKVNATVTVVDEEEVAAVVVSDSFDLSDISLDKTDEDGSILTQNRDRDLAYLKLLDNDRMMYNFYKTFGQTDKIANVTPLGGWDDPTGLLRGHSTGHYISALALAYGSTGDTEIKEKLDDIVHEMRTLQEMSEGDPAAFKTKGVLTATWSTNPKEWGEGFLSGYSPDQFALLEQYTGYAGPDEGIWAPYYTLHKLLAGFIDAYNYAGNEEALEVAKDLGMWATKRLSACSQEQLTKMWDMYIAGEFGGFNESLAQLYILTGDQAYLDGAKLFDNTNFFEKLAVNVDDIATRHANQHIPQIIGALEMYEATVKAGTPEVYYYNIAENFWQMTVSRYAYSIGGVGTGEKFTQPYQQANNIAGTTNCETCAAYNMMKLTKMLNNYNPDDAEYMDYYERTLYNQILASQTPNVTSYMHNGTTYMLPIGPGSTRGYGGDYDSFTCCHGTGMENHVKYQEAAYAKTDDTLYVGLYLPTTLTWEEKGVIVTQETDYPSEDTKLTVSAMDDAAVGAFDMKLRVPYWATNGFTVKVNGETTITNPEISTYVTVENVSAGDEIEINMPWTLHLDKTPDKIGNSEVASVMYGPFVMAAELATTDWKTLVLSSDLTDSIKVSEDTTTGFPTLTANGYSFAPMFAPQYATEAYHAYFKVLTADDDGSKWYEAKISNTTPKYGTFTIDADMVKEGGKLVITAAPNDGYMVKLLTINGEAVQIGEDNTYTVENVSADMVIEGSFRLINPPTPNPAHLEFTATASSDFTASWETVDGPLTDWEPTVSAAGTGKGWGNWPQDPGSEHYVQYSWDTTVTADKFEIFWYDDGGGTRIPASFKFMYLDENGAWQEATLLTAYEDAIEIDKYNTINIEPITTTAIKLVMTVHADGAANGILRWKVSDSKAAADAEKKELEEAKEALTTELTTTKEAVAGLKEADYTADTWNALKEAIAAADAALAKEDVTVNELNAAKAAITEAYAKLKTVVEVEKEEAAEALMAEITATKETVEGLKEADYTAESWKALMDALTAATEVELNENATAKDYTDAKDALAKALAGLQKAQGGDATTPGGDATTPGDSAVTVGVAENLSASWTGKATVKLTWSAAANANNYVIYRSTGGTYTAIASTTATSYTDTKAVAGKNNTYKVVASKEAVNGAESKLVSVYVAKAPTGIKAKVKGKKVTVSFKRDKKVTGYEIYRATKKNGKFKKVATINKNKTVKKVLKVTKKGTYYFKVRSFKKVNGKKIYTDYTKAVKAKVK
ncbi:MAG: glycoside hydrolase family 127 protein, partial [Lachnospiraceae bacterium]|nr:glycoside hydrolase family 127 protein [Lachnospiraceae bacterium]